MIPALLCLSALALIGAMFWRHKPEPYCSEYDRWEKRPGWREDFATSTKIITTRPESKPVISIKRKRGL